MSTATNCFDRNLSPQYSYALFLLGGMQMQCLNLMRNVCAISARLAPQQKNISVSKWKEAAQQQDLSPEQRARMLLTTIVTPDGFNVDGTPITAPPATTTQQPQRTPEQIAADVEDLNLQWRLLITLRLQMVDMVKNYPLLRVGALNLAGYIKYDAIRPESFTPMDGDALGIQILGIDEESMRSLRAGSLSAGDASSSSGSIPAGAAALAVIPTAVVLQPATAFSTPAASVQPLRSAEEPPQEEPQRRAVKRRLSEDLA